MSSAPGVKRCFKLFLHHSQRSSGGRDEFLTMQSKIASRPVEGAGVMAPIAAKMATDFAIFSHFSAELDGYCAKWKELVRVLQRKFAVGISIGDEGSLQRVRP
ncbi:hypothetical protein [Bradyrhizobium sp. USDA 4353]